MFNVSSKPDVSQLSAYGHQKLQLKLRNYDCKILHIGTIWTTKIYFLQRVKKNVLILTKD